MTHPRYLAAAVEGAHDQLLDSLRALCGEAACTDLADRLSHPLGSARSPVFSPLHGSDASLYRGGDAVR